MKSISQKLVSAKRLAEILGCDESTIYKLKSAGAIPFLQPGGKHHMIRFPESILDEITAHSQPAECEKRPTATKISGPLPKWLAEK